MNYHNEAHRACMQKQLGGGNYLPQTPIKDEITFAGPEPLDPARVERIAVDVLLVIVIALIGAGALWAYGPGWAQWLTWIAP